METRQKLLISIGVVFVILLIAVVAVFIITKVQDRERSRRWDAQVSQDIAEKEAATDAAVARAPQTCLNYAFNQGIDSRHFPNPVTQSVEEFRRFATLEKTVLVSMGQGWYCRVNIFDGTSFVNQFWEVR
jgi:Na+-transporting methylmalonyl-CoA/oxaloacetate decarboxylase gamma subunit